MVRIRTISLFVLFAACRATAPTRPTTTVRAAPPTVTPVAAPPSDAVAGYVSLAAGNDFACALRGDGTVWCWGDDTHGTLGDGAPLEDRAEPRPVPGLSEVVRVVAQNSLACAVTRSGSVACWGAWERADHTGSFLSASPVVVRGAGDAVDVAVSAYHLVVVRRDGSAVRWRADRGPVFPDDASEAMALHDATLATAATRGICLATRAGPVWCDGPLGPRSFAYAPGVVRGIYGARSEVFVIREGGAVDRLALDNEPRPRVAPQPLTGVTAFSANATGSLFAREGRVYSWRDAFDWRGEPAERDESAQAEPTPVWRLRDARAVALGGGFACALVGDDTLRCWGQNNHGQLAEPTGANGGIAARILLSGGAPLTGVRDLAVHEHAVCAIMERGPARCWGTWNALPALFDAGVIGSELPLARAGLGDAAAIAGRTPSACVASPEGALRCARVVDPPVDEDGEPLTNEGPHQEFDTPALPAPASSLAASASAMCASLRDGSVACDTTSFETSATTPLLFAPVRGLSNVSRVVAAGGVLCALSETAPPRCWGDDFEWGLIARSTTRSHPRPVVREGLGVVLSLAAGPNHACAVERGGTVRCWGQGRGGQLGVGLVSERAWPVEVPGARGAVEVAVGTAHTCARMENGTVRCWGGNEQGQLGDGRSPRAHATPEEVPGLERVTRLVASSDFTCARRDDGTVWCWGSGNERVYGDGVLGPDRAPTQVSGE